MFLLSPVSISTETRALWFFLWRTPRRSGKRRNGPGSGPSFSSAARSASAKWMCRWPKPGGSRKAAQRLPQPQSNRPAQPSSDIFQLPSLVGSSLAFLVGWLVGWLVGRSIGRLVSQVTQHLSCPANFVDTCDFRLFHTLNAFKSHSRVQFVGKDWVACKRVADNIIVWCL